MRKQRREDKVTSVQVARSAIHKLRIGSGPEEKQLLRVVRQDSSVARCLEKEP